MRINKILIILSAIFVLGACSDFDEYNENPNEPTAVSPSVLFPSAIRQSVTTMVNESFLLGNNAAQLTAKTLRTEVDTYNWNAFPTVWEGLYESLTDAIAVEEIAAESDNAALEGAAIVLRSWIFGNLTNAYGDIPYSEAITGDEGEFTPAYDDQQAIYQDLLSELSRASTLLASGNGNITGDILFNGDASKWQKLANSLSLRYIMLAHNQLGDASSRFAQIATSGNVMTSNEDNAILDYLGSFPNQFPLIPLKVGDFDAVAFSETALNVMSAYNDPRLARYARPDNDDYSNPEFSGAQNGAGTCEKAGSRLGAQYFNDPAQTTAAQLGLEMADGIIMTYSEVEFLMAEAAERGWIADDTEAHYRAGIEASMDYYQVDYAPFGYTDFGDYYANSGVAFNTTTDIWEQKWLSLYFTGLTPYFEVRRWYFEGGMSWDGIPFLDAACDNLNNGNLPMKFLYPGEEQSLNSANYQDAVQRLGGSNDFNATTWLTE